ncbi:MAG: hypothetical protein LC776_04895 [Acidobacteria bacterium]|nr:hypothetical protein [Acidobacteriota bacterium]
MTKAQGSVTSNGALFFNSHGSGAEDEGRQSTKAGEASRDNEWAQKDITEKTAELTSN